MSQDSGGIEKRRYTRVEVGFDLVYRSGGALEVRMKADQKDQYASTIDVSQGGLAIVTDRFFEVGSDLDIEFHLIFREYQTPPMPAKGRVKYCAPLEEKGKYRLGIELLEIAQEDEKEIEDFVNLKTRQK